eukprot:Skav206536  [mRNA]  locus=scaffold504:189513:190547:+ [translate_table: standard]
MIPVPLPHSNYFWWHDLRRPNLRPTQSPFEIFTKLEQLEDGFASVEEAEDLLFSTWDKSTINGWVLRELLWAFENDMEARQQIARRSAGAFEESVAAYCAEAGVPIQREEDLRKVEGIPTPDVLFASPVTFQLESGAKMELRWLECKSFHAGAENRATLKKLKKQAQRYTEALGPGAMVFAAGAAQRVRDSMEQLGVGTLDGSELSPESEGSSLHFVSGPKAKFWKMPYDTLFGRTGNKARSATGSGDKPAVEKTPSGNARKKTKKKSKESKPEECAGKVSSTKGTKAKRKSQKKNKRTKKKASQADESQASGKSASQEEQRNGTEIGTEKNAVPRPKRRPPLP